MSAIWEWLNRPLTTVDLVAYGVGWWLGGKAYEAIAGRRTGRHEVTR